MTEEANRPIGITVLGWLHLTIGGLAALGLTVQLVMGIQGGIPLLSLLAIVAAAVLGPGLGRALLNGRPWSWYVGLLLWVGVAASACLVLPDLLERLTFWSAPAAAVPWIAGGLAGAAGIFALLLMTGASHCELQGSTRWVVLAVAVVIAGGASYGGYVLKHREPVVDMTVDLQRLGEGRANSPEDIELMLDKLENGNVDERSSAAWALGRSGRGDVIAKLIEAANDDRDLNVRINAVSSIGELGGPEILDELTALLGDGKLEIRQAALRALAADRFKGAMPQVGQLMVDDDELRGAAVDVLGNMGDPAAVRFLEQVAGDDDRDVRTRVAFALGKLGDPRAVSVLTRLVEDPAWEVRANAAQALGMVGDAGARPALQTASKDSNEHVRAAAESALQRLGGG